MVSVLKYIFRYSVIFVFGGCAYYYLEVLFRGWSHWSMFLLGAVCFVFFSLQKKVPWWNQSLPWQLFRCLLFAFVGEFITGCMVNLWKGWAVWDYSEVPLNILGQVCLPMEIIFLLICYFALVLDDFLFKYVLGEESSVPVKKIPEL